MMKQQRLNLVNVWIITYKTEQQDSRIGAVYLTLLEAVQECERLEAACDYVGMQAMPVQRQVEISALLEMAEFAKVCKERDAE